MPTHARAHEDNRKIVCLICLRKCSRQLTAFMWERISKIYGITFDETDPRIPQGILSSCHKSKNEECINTELTA